MPNIFEKYVKVNYNPSNDVDSGFGANELEDVESDVLPGDPPLNLKKEDIAINKRFDKKEDVTDTDAKKDKSQRAIHRDSIKDSITKARDEIANKNNKTPLKDISTTKIGARTDKEATDVVENTEKIVKDDTQETKDLIEAPKGWTDEAKAAFNDLPEVVKASIAKREKETSQGFKEYGEKTSKLQQYDAVLAKYTPDIQNFGVTPPQMVERLFQWFDVLRHQDKKQAVNHLKQLANNFGLTEELSKSFSPQNTLLQPQPSQPPAQQTNQSALPPEVTQILQDLNGKVQTLQQAAEARERESAKQAEVVAKQQIEGWSKDKPYFEQVRGRMRELIEKGLVPLKDNRLDLDRAYILACRENDEIYTKIRAEELANKELELAKRTNDSQAIQKATEDVQRAKRANVSIKPSAPTAKIIPQSVNKKPASVRDSLTKAIAEVRGG